MKIKYISKLFLLALLFMVACEDEETLSVPSNRIVVNSIARIGNVTQVGREFTLGDVSTGVESREWRIEKDLADIVGSDNDTLSTDNILKARILKTGIYDINLSQKFKDIAFDGVGGNNTGVKELDSLITINVLDSVQISNVKAFVLDNDGEPSTPLTIASNQLNEVNAGKIVRYTFDILGVPNALTADSGNARTVEGSEVIDIENNKASIDVKYASIANYDMTLSLTRAVPVGSTTRTVSNLIKIVPSTEPVTLDKLSILNGQISLIFSRDMNESSIVQEDFSVNITNGTFSSDATIESITIDPENKNVLLVDLNESIQVYDDDAVTITYTGEQLITDDFVFADKITAQEVEIDLSDRVNILETAGNTTLPVFDYGFETSDAAKWVYLFWGSPWDKYTTNITSEQAHSGFNSLKISMEAEGGAIIGHKTTNADGDSVFITFNVEADKTYQIGAWSYVENTGSTPAESNMPDLRFFTNPETDWGISATHTFTSDYVTGEWVYGTSTQKFRNTGEVSFSLRAFNQFNPEKLDVYLDDISVKELRLRP